MHSGSENFLSPGQKNSSNQINQFHEIFLPYFSWKVSNIFSWNCIFGSCKHFPQFKNWFLAIFEIGKNELWSKKISWNWFIWFDEFFYPDFFKFSGPLWHYQLFVYKLDFTNVIFLKRWNGDDRWYIGFDTVKGQNRGLAYIIRDEICIHKISDYDWWWLCSNKGNYNICLHYELWSAICLQTCFHEFF